MARTEIHGLRFSSDIENFKQATRQTPILANISTTTPTAAVMAAREATAMIINAIFPGAMTDTRIMPELRPHMCDPHLAQLARKYNFNLRVLKIPTLRFWTKTALSKPQFYGEFWRSGFKFSSKIESFQSGTDGPVSGTEGPVRAGPLLIAQSPFKLHPFLSRF